MLVGILGGGQLGRMLALAGIPLGIRCRVLDPNANAPAAIVAEQIVGDYDDYAALADFVRGLDCVSYEFENVPVTAARWLADRVPVFPPPEALACAQDRLTEKSFFQDLGVPTPAFAAVDTSSDLMNALARIGLPAVLKTRRFGYDGKGQAVLQTVANVQSAWLRLGGRPLILEQFVPFDREVSLLAVRDRQGSVTHYPLIENTHRDGILRTSLAPAGNSQLNALAREYAHAALAQLNYIGVLAVEFFAVGDRLLVNEMAPRVHNSGHWTIEGAATSQFANHMRAIGGLPLGSTEVYGAAGMVNLIGHLPNRAAVLAIPGTSWHEYGKEPRPGRKVGHVTVTAGNISILSERLHCVQRHINFRAGSVSDGS